MITLQRLLLEPWNSYCLLLVVIRYFLTIRYFSHTTSAYACGLPKIQRDTFTKNRRPVECKLFVILGPHLHKKAVFKVR